MTALKPAKTEKSGLTATLLLAVITASITWFTLGYNIVALNGPQVVVIDWIRSVVCLRQITNVSALWCAFISEEDQPAHLAVNTQLSTLWAIASSIPAFGSLAAILTCASLVNRFGPKHSLYLVAVVTVLGAAVASFSPLAVSFEMLIVGRLILGFAMGMTCAITNIYTSEVAPVSLRGAMGTVPVISMVVGMGIGTVLGLPFLLGSGTRWAVLIALQLVPVVIMCVGLLFCPESPAFLYIGCKNREGAERALIWLRRTKNVDAELTELEKEMIASNHRKDISIIEIFKQARFRYPLLVCAVNMAAQDMAGFGCVTTYSTSIFTSIGLTVINSIYASLGLWLTHLVFALATMLMIDRIGRRTLLLVSHAGILVSFCVMITCMALARQGYPLAKYGSAVSLFAYISAYTVGLAIIPYILPSELFPQEARAAAMTVVCVVNCTAILGATFVFSVVVNWAQEYTFIAFVVLTLVSGVFIFCKQPETRGKSIEEIQILLRDHRMLK